MTRQSLSRFLSERSELRIFMARLRESGRARGRRRRGAETIGGHRSCQPAPAPVVRGSRFGDENVFAQIENLAAAALALAIGVAVPVEACCAQTPPPAIVAPSDQDAKFRSFLAEFRTTALNTGIDPQIYDSAMAGIARNPRVEALNLEQPEFAKPVWDYLDSAASSERIANGQALL